MRLIINADDVPIVDVTEPTHETFRGDPVALRIGTSSKAHPNLYIRFDGVWYIAQMSPAGVHTVWRLSASRLVNATTYRNVLRWKDSTQLTASPFGEWTDGYNRLYLNAR